MSIQTQIERLERLRNALRIKLYGMDLVGPHADFEECVDALSGVDVHGYTFTAVTDANENYKVPKGYYPEGCVVGVNDEDLVPGNIKGGVTILGVPGELTDHSGETLDLQEATSTTLDGITMPVRESGVIDGTTKFFLNLGHIAYDILDGNAELLSGLLYGENPYLAAGKTMLDGNIIGTYDSDATATSEDILSGKTAYVNGSKVTGNIQDITEQTLDLQEATSTTLDGITMPVRESGVIDGTTKFFLNLGHIAYDILDGNSELLSGLLYGENPYLAAGKTMLDGNIVGTYDSDATASAGDILSGKTAYVNGSKVTGNLQDLTEQTLALLAADETSISGLVMPVSGEGYIDGTTRFKLPSGSIVYDICDGDSELLQAFINRKNPYLAAGKTMIDGNIVGTYTSDATATAAEVLDGKTAYVDGQKITGSLKTQMKTVTPSKSQKFVTPDRNYLISSVLVNAIPDEYITTTDATASAGDILSGKTAYVNGSKVTGNMPDLAEQTLDLQEATSTTFDGIMMPVRESGVIDGTTKFNLNLGRIAYDILDGNAELLSGLLYGENPYLAAGKTMLDGNIVGTYDSDATASAGDILSGKTAYVNGSKVTGKYATPPTGSTFKNLISNGSFETDTVWTTWEGTNSFTTADKYVGSRSFISTSSNLASQPIPTPVVGHKYYAREYIRSTGEISADDCRFEIHGGDGVGLNWVFGWNNGNHPSWDMISGIVEIDILNASSYVLRTFVVNGKSTVYIDGIMLIDLTACCGAGNEPSKEWCDINIPYFEGEKSFGWGMTSTPPDPDGEVRFYDYDGSLLYSYSLADIQSQSELPQLPSHYGLTCQGWNWTLDELKALSYGVNVGAMYITDDEATKLHIEIPNTTMLTVPLAIYQSVSAGVTVDWGDGSATQTVSGTGNISLSHTYPAKGEYTISLLPKSNCTLRLGHSSSGYNVLGEVNDNTRCVSNMLKGVNLGRKVTAITSYAFQYCRGLEYITLTNAVTSMGNYSFQYASSVKCVIVPVKVPQVPMFTFGYCFALRTVSLPLKVATLGASAFRSCHCLESITVPPNVTTLNGYVFSENYCLKRANVPSTVTSFGNFVFDKCYALTEFDFPESVTSLGSNAFYQNYSLSKLDISDSTTSIGTYACYDCHALTELDLPASLTKIESFAFQNCYGLKRIWVRATTPPVISSSSFLGIPDDCVIYVPAGTLAAYSAKSGWQDYIDFLREAQ